MENEQKNAVQVYQPQSTELGAFSNIGAFESAQRMAKALAESELVPQQYRGKLANCLVALEVAQRCQASPLMVMQNLNLIHGRPSWSSSYIIAAINSCGRFAPLKFRKTGEGDNRTCVAWTTDRATGEILEGPPVSIGMAKAEGWYEKSGSKWKTMPELMLMYRSGAFFGRLYAPEILMGMRTDDEEREIITVESSVVETRDAVEEVNSKIRGAKRTAAEKKAAEKPPTENVSESESKENATKDETEEKHF